MSTSVLLEESSSSSSSSSRERWWKRRRRGCLCMVLRGSSGVDDDQVEEARGQAMFAVPMIVTNMSYYAITLISVMFASHLGDVEFAGATLGNSWGTVTGTALMTGLSGALDTPCGQAYGAKLHRMLGIYLQFAIITSTFFSIIASILWLFSESILIWLQQEAEVSKMAVTYLKYFVPGLFAYGLLQCMLRFMQTQSVVIPLVVCSVLSLLVHVAITHLLVHVIGLGFKGSSLSGSISLWLSAIVLAIYVNFSKEFKYTWEGLSFESFEYVAPSMKLAIPSAVMVCLEYWAFEILVLLAGLMPNSKLSTSLVAMCTRVSNEMGAGNVEKAKVSVAVTLKLSILKKQSNYRKRVRVHDSVSRRIDTVRLGTRESYQEFLEAVGGST